MKTNLYIEFNGKQLEDKLILANIKKKWTEAGNKLGDMKTLSLYIKPEEQTVYYVINEMIHEKIEL